MTAPLDNKNKQLLREKTLRYLAERFPLRFEPSTIVQALRDRGRIDFPASVSDVEEALAILRGLKLVESEHAKLGSTIYWASTQDGVFAVERGEV